MIFLKPLNTLSFLFILVLFSHMSTTRSHAAEENTDDTALEMSPEIKAELKKLTSNNALPRFKLSITPISYDWGSVVDHPLPANEVTRDHFVAVQSSERFQAFSELDFEMIQSQSGRIANPVYTGYLHVTITQDVISDHHNLNLIYFPQVSENCLGFCPAHAGIQMSYQALDQTAELLITSWLGANRINSGREPFLSGSVYTQFSLLDFGFKVSTQNHFKSALLNMVTFKLDPTVYIPLTKHTSLVLKAKGDAIYQVSYSNSAENSNKNPMSSHVQINVAAATGLKYKNTSLTTEIESNIEPQLFYHTNSAYENQWISDKNGDGSLHRTNVKLKANLSTNF